MKRQRHISPVIVSGKPPGYTFVPRLSIMTSFNAEPATSSIFAPSSLAVPAVQSTNTSTPTSSFCAFAMRGLLCEPPAASAAGFVRDGLQLLRLLTEPRDDGLRELSRADLLLAVPSV